MRKVLWIPVLLFVILSVSQVNSFSFKDLFNKSNLKKAAKTYVIAGIVRKFSDELNNFINGLLLNNSIPNKELTKVVPLIGGGTHTAVGGAQVSGPADKLAQVQAVFQVDGEFQRGKFKVMAYIPTTSSTELDRVYGVGVTAIIDYHAR
jgi:hypothetical protein